MRKGKIGRQDKWTWTASLPSGGMRYKLKQEDKTEELVLLFPLPQVL